MNTRIYFNDKFLEFQEPAVQASHNQPIKAETRKEREKSLSTLLDEFTDESKKDNVLIRQFSFDETLELMKKSFYYIEAAGGFIEKDGKYLFIRRHDRWDLPKGKLEKNESAELGAIRECEEECGITELKITGKLPSTYHMYHYKDGYALKQSFWFRMQTTFNGKLTPQLEEYITEVRWFSPQEVDSEVLRDTYYTIADVTFAALNR